jgi:hypothetical protein
MVLRIFSNSVRGELVEALFSSMRQKESETPFGEAQDRLRQVQGERVGSEALD